MLSSTLVWAISSRNTHTHTHTHNVHRWEKGTHISIRFLIPFDCAQFIVDTFILAFFFFFYSGPQRWGFYRPRKQKEEKETRSKVKRAKDGKPSSGMQSTFRKVQATSFYFVHSTYIHRPSKEQIPCLSSCWLFVSISSHLYYFFFFLPLCGISCAHRQTHLSYCMAAMSPYCSFHIWFRFVLCYYYDTQRDVAATANDDAEYNVLRSRQF